MQTTELVITTPDLFMTLPPPQIRVNDDDHLTIKKTTCLKLHRAGSSSPTPSILSTDLIAGIKAECKCPKCEPHLHQLAKHPVDNSMFFLNGLTVWSHDAHFLATWAAHSFNRYANTAASATGHSFRSLNREQQLAIYHWDRFRDSSEHQTLACPPRRLARLDPEEALYLPLEIFNHLFFLGQLSSHVVRLRWDDYKGDANHGLRLGYTENFEHETYIHLNPYHPRHRNNATGLLRTLLHEMIHAFLGRYACYNTQQRCRNVWCKTVHHDNYGTTGHGRAWQILAKGIEDIGPELLRGFSIWLGRIESAVLEVKAGGWRPTECDIEDLFGKEGPKLRMRMNLGTKDDDGVMWRMMLKNGDVLWSVRKK